MFLGRTKMSTSSNVASEALLKISVCDPTDLSNLTHLEVRKEEVNRDHHLSATTIVVFIQSGYLP